MKLGEALSFRNGKTSPDRSEGGMYQVHGSNGVIGYCNQSNAPAGATVIGRVGSYCGNVHFLQSDSWVTDNAIFAFPKADQDPRYWYFVLCHLKLGKLRHGSGQPLLNQEILSGVDFDPQTLSEQQRIAGVLGALDDKIESNCAQQRIGEQLLRAVIEGILGQFSEADFISFDAYCTQSKESVRPENIGNGDKYIALEHMPRGSVFLNSWETAKLAGIASNKTRFRHGDLLFGKLRPYFKKVGVAPVSGVCSTDILVIRPRLPEFLPFIAVIASSDALIDSISASATGTRMPRASWKEIATWSVPQIPDETLTVLLHPANQLMAFLETLSLQNLKLAQLRDALLPELMSGRMRVDEAGRLVSEALDEEVADV